MIVARTLLRRWYVVLFLVGYVAASVPERGWKATLRFAAIAIGVAFAAEYSSTRTGFPFTRYAYAGDTRGEEVFLSNVPAFVPVSYAFMIYAGRSLASLVARSRAALVALGAAATTALDLVVDPVAVRGSHWFLGDLFHYASSGPWFGVPLGNFGGWLLVAATVIALDLLVAPGDAVRPSPWGAWLGAGIVAFNLGVAFAIGALAVGFAALAVTGIIGLALFPGAWRPPSVESARRRVHRPRALRRGERGHQRLGD